VTSNSTQINDNNNSIKSSQDDYSRHIWENKNYDLNFVYILNYYIFKPAGIMIAEEKISVQTKDNSNAIYKLEIKSIKKETLILN